MNNDLYKEESSKKEWNMSPSIDAVFSAALSLPPDNRAALAEKLLESLDEVNQTAVDAAWAEGVRLLAKEATYRFFG